MAAWGAAGAPKKRSAEAIRDVIDNLFCTRFWDKGMCQSCKKELPGIFGPEAHGSFYCRACWVKHLGDTTETNEATWQEWIAWKPQMEESQRTVLSGTPQEHELKCALLTLSKVGGSISFLPGPSSYTRMKVHTFCKEEPALQGLKTKSYGKDSERFMKVFSQDQDPTFNEVRLHLEPEALQEMDLTKLQDWQQMLTLGLEKIKDEMSQRSTNGASVINSGLSEGHPNGAAQPEVEGSIYKDGRLCKSMESDTQRNASENNSASGTPKSVPKAPPKAPAVPPKAPGVPQKAAHKAPPSALPAPMAQAPPTPQSASPLLQQAVNKIEGGGDSPYLADGKDVPYIEDAGNFPSLGGFPALGGSAGSKKKGGKKK